MSALCYRSTKPIAIVCSRKRSRMQAQNTAWPTPSYWGSICALFVLERKRNWFAGLSRLSAMRTGRFGGHSSQHRTDPASERRKLLEDNSELSQMRFQSTNANSPPS